jgi:hypothetical protein
MRDLPVCPRHGLDKRPGLWYLDRYHEQEPNSHLAIYVKTCDRNRDTAPLLGGVVTFVVRFLEGVEVHRVHSPYTSSAATSAATDVLR